MVSNKCPQKSLTFWLRAECYEFSRHSKQWTVSRIRLENATGFPASVEDRAGRRLIIAGGREWRTGNISSPWRYFSSVRAITSGGEYLALPDLPEPLADHCLVITEAGARRRLWVIGGSNKPQRYRVEVHARDLNDPSGLWTRMPDLLDARQWQGCALRQISTSL